MPFLESIAGQVNDRADEKKFEAATFQIQWKQDGMQENNRQLIYKLLAEEEWMAFQNDGVFVGSKVDIEDGYIHFSSGDQVAETAAKHFSHLSEIWLVTVDAELVGDNLKWEPSRGGALFPHLYGHLLIGAVVESRKVVAGTTGFGLQNL